VRSLRNKCLLIPFRKPSRPPSLRASTWSSSPRTCRLNRRWPSTSSSLRMGTSGRGWMCAGGSSSDVCFFHTMCLFPQSHHCTRFTFHILLHRFLAFL
jgi:hypothetical protein